MHSRCSLAKTGCVPRYGKLGRFQSSRHAEVHNSTEIDGEFLDHLLLGVNSCGTADKKTLLRETHGNSKTVHFSLLKTCSWQSIIPSSNRALDNEREKISIVACVVEEKARVWIAWWIPAKSFWMHKSTKFSAVAFTSEMPSSIAPETKAGQCVLVCGLPTSSLLPSAAIILGGLGFAFGKWGDVWRWASARRSGSNAPLQHVRIASDSSMCVATDLRPWSLFDWEGSPFEKKKKEKEKQKRNTVFFQKEETAKTETIQKQMFLFYFLQEKMYNNFLLKKAVVKSKRISKKKRYIQKGQLKKRKKRKTDVQEREQKKIKFKNTRL